MITADPIPPPSDQFAAPSIPEPPIDELNYASLSTLPESPRARYFFRIAVACALFPMFFVITIYLLLAVTHTPIFFPFALSFMIPTGVGVVLFGLAFLLRYAIVTRKAPRIAATLSVSPRAGYFFRAAVACAFLLLSLGITITTIALLFPDTRISIFSFLFLCILLWFPFAFGVVLLGLAFLLISAIVSRKFARVAGVPWKKRPLLLTLLLLFASLPVAVACPILGVLACGDKIIINH